MTTITPNDVAPQEPTDGQEEGAQAQANQTPDPAPQEAQQGEQEGKTFPESHVKDLRRENAARRDENKQLRTELDSLKQALGKALGFGDDTDSQSIEQTVEQVTGERDKYLQEATAAQRELTALRAATKAGVDADRLLDSRRFTQKLDALDPTASDYTTQVESLIKTAAQDDPSLTLNPAPGASGTHEHQGNHTPQDQTDISWFR
jgi:hypothetical protein